MNAVHLGAVAAIVPGVVSCWDGAGPWTAPPAVAHREAAIDVQKHLAGVRHRYFNDTSRFSVAAARSCVGQRPQLAWHALDGTRRGVVVGTTVADYTVRDRLDREVIANGAASINAVFAPNVSSNIASAHVSIDQQARAFTTTLTSPFLAGLESLAVGVLSLRANQADSVLAIAAEAALPPGDSTVITPGAVCVCLQRRPSTSGRAIVDIHAGYHAAGAESRLPHSALKFLDAALNSPRAAPGFVVIRDRSAHGKHTADAWLREASSNGRHATANESALDDAGAVAPLLAAMPSFTGDNPVVLLAIYRGRYVAFSIAQSI
ncbi:beta-ketoacyl synthase N-terminal-like domain-containing protein [Paraburkholderia sp. PREW-6R]|uniref:beta-ketoacyl synthase N-terminal-like domain-containing protein n=1 Tax=Paraburkholderia sp. PREW-6R TaxID=3141544 RepID=UPI0031F4AC64